MAYYSGTASSLADLRTALLTHAQTDGWVLTGDVLSKAGVYFQIQATTDHVTCLGCESNAVSNPAPSHVRIGLIWIGTPGQVISFPCAYEVFGFAQELYLVANYDVDAYQWMAFGKSSVPGLPGQGGWCGASAGAQNSSASGGAHWLGVNYGGGGSGNPVSGSGVLFHTTLAYHTIARNSWANSGFDGHGWTWNGAVDSDPIGVRQISTLLALQPSVWNSEATLLPLRAYKQRPSYKSSLVADLDNARLLRIDNLSPGDVLTLGPDKWKIFPWYRKDAAARDGGTLVNHTGTFGWAIRYEGP